MSRTTTFTCDVCKHECKNFLAAEHKPDDNGWIQLNIAPYHHAEQPEKVPTVFRDVCSTACAVKLLKGWQASLEQLRREATR